MKTIDEAWQWYTNAKQTLKQMARLGEKYWEGIPKLDRYFLDKTQEEIVRAATNASENLDDLAIIVLFSVFEANIRGLVLEEMKDQESQYQHRVIIDAINSAKDRVGEGSFYYLLSSFKGTDNNLIEQVNQVRKYRNWVSHGKRGAQPSLVSPPIARDRLTRSMALLFPSVPNEWIAVGAY